MRNKFHIIFIIIIIIMNLYIYFNFINLIFFNFHIFFDVIYLYNKIPPPFFFIYLFIYLYWNRIKQFSLGFYPELLMREQLIKYLQARNFNVNLKIKEFNNIKW